jgi:hypothetical protein
MSKAAAGSTAAVGPDEMEAFLTELKAIPNDEKSAYFAVLSQNPILLEAESCIERFLRFEEWNAKTAARRFIGYWEKRKSIFHAEKAYLPMTLSPGGALTESCIDFLRDGWIAPLPAEQSGRRVCFLNLMTEKLRYQQPRDDRTSCLFYVLQVISEGSSAQTEGITLVILYDDQCNSPEAVIDAFENILRIMPLRVASLHVIPSSKKSAQGKFFEDFVPKSLKTLLSMGESDHETVLENHQQVYTDKTFSQVLTSLEASGMPRTNLPTVLGGRWSMAHHATWLKLRMEEEHTRFSTLKDTAITTDFPDEKATTGVSLTSLDKNRRREARHSRQKRDRKRCRVKGLKLHIEHLEDNKYKVRFSNRVLEEKLKQATEIAKQVEAVVGSHPSLAGLWRPPVGPSPAELAFLQRPASMFGFSAPPLPAVQAGFPYAIRQPSMDPSLLNGMAVAANAPVALLILPGQTLPALPYGPPSNPAAVPPGLAYAQAPARHLPPMQQQHFLSPPYAQHPAPPPMDARQLQILQLQQQQQQPPPGDPYALYLRRPPPGAPYYPPGSWPPPR